LGLAYPERIAQQRGGHGRFRLANGSGAILPEHDPLAKSEFIAVATLDNSQNEARIFLAGALTRTEIEEHFADLIEDSEGVFWDGKAQSVSAAKSEKLGAIVLEERPISDASPELLQEAMAQGVAAMGLSSLPWDDSVNLFRARITFLARVMPELPWPDFADSHLLATIKDWLHPYLSGMTRKAHLARLDMLAILRGMVPHELLSRVEKLAPSRMEVPGGGHYRIDYQTDGDPILSVRLQEMFGMKSAPQIAEGRARLKIEFLSPAGRPVAVTQSLETFWLNGYPDVRKDLRGRYPKHSWPEDPLTAQAVAPRRLR
jgi:ATP-dependent helicase HrpB